MDAMEDTDGGGGGGKRRVHGELPLCDLQLYGCGDGSATC